MSYCRQAECTVGWGDDGIYGSGELQYDHCPIEGTCLAHCTDFAGHCSPLAELERQERAADYQRLRELEAAGSDWGGMPTPGDVSSDGDVY